MVQNVFTCKQQQQQQQQRKFKFNIKIKYLTYNFSHLWGKHLVTNNKLRSVVWIKKNK